MAEGPEVVVGQRYRDRNGNRELLVTDVKLQDKTEGRLKARYTYATVSVVSSKNWNIKNGATRKIDTDRLRSRFFKLVFSPCHVTDEGSQDACPVPRSEASTPQDEP